MAYEFASRLETFPNYRKFETTFAGRPFVVETGKMCGLSNGSAMIRYGETCVLCNVTMSDKPRDGVDFFPLSVEFEEKLYAAGRIPGSFMRREGRPGEHAILSSRVVDRPIRPLFPKDMRNDVCVTMTVMSQDPDCSAEISGMNGASLAIAMSDIPWNGPIAGVFVGLVDGEIVLNPTKEQREHSDLSLTLAASEEKIVMIEAGANEVDEETMMKAIRAGHEEIRKMLAFINSIVAEIGKPKKSFTPVELDHALLADVYANHLEDVKAAMNTDDKNVRDAAMLPIMDAIAAEHPELTAADLDLISYKLQKKVVRTWLLEDGKRVDGRGINEIRPLAAEVGLLRPAGQGVGIRAVTFGRVQDYQIRDINNMGAAMAPAASATLLHYLRDTHAESPDFDAIYTGDLGHVGSQLFRELLAAEGLLLKNHVDCGCILYDAEAQTVKSGGSGAGCCAAVLCAHILPRLERGTQKRLLFLATGALMSQTTFLQKESIPAIAHLVELWTPKKEGIA